MPLHSKFTSNTVICFICEICNGVQDKKDTLLSMIEGPSRVNYMLQSVPPIYAAIFDYMKNSYHFAFYNDDTNFIHLIGLSPTFSRQCYGPILQKVIMRVEENASQTFAQVQECLLKGGEDFTGQLKAA